MNEAQKPNNGDRHASTFMLRLPEVFRHKLQLLRQRTGRPMTALVCEALKRYLARFGLWSKRDEADGEAVTW
jgi:hypothetical protein